MTAADRVVVAVLLSITVPALVMLAMLIFGHGPLHLPTSPVARASAILMTVGGSAIAAAVLAGTLTVPDSSVGASAKVMARVVRFLPGVGLALLAVTALSMHEVLRVSSASVWILIRVVLWTGLGISCVYVLRPYSPRSFGLVDFDRTARVVLPLSVIVVAVAITTVVGLSPKVISRLLVPPSSFVGITGYPVMLGLFIMAAVNGLSSTRDRGERLSHSIASRQGLVALLLVVKLIALLAFCVALHYTGSDSLPFSWATSAWLFAISAAAIAIFLFMVDDRISLSSADYSVVARNAAFVLPAIIGFGIFVAALLAIALGFAIGRPFALVAMAAIIGLAVVPRYIRMGRIRRTFYGFAVLAAVIGAVVLGSRPPPARPLYTGKNQDSEALLVVGVFVAFVVTVIGLVWVLISTLKKRRFGLFTYLLTVVAWIALLRVWDTVSAPIRWTQFDIVLTLLLMILVFASMAGLRHAVDPVEVVLAAAVTFLLIEYAAFSNFLPRSVQVLPVLLAVLGPGVVAVWTSLAALSRQSEQRTAMVRLATTALLYQQIAAIAWRNDQMNVSAFIDNLSDVTLGYISIPLVLLLIAAREPARGRLPAAAGAG